MGARAAGPCTVLTDAANDQQRTYGSDGRAIDVRSLQMANRTEMLIVTLRVANLGSVGTATLAGEADYFVEWTSDRGDFTAHATRSRGSWRFGVILGYPVRDEARIPGEADPHANTISFHVPYELAGVRGDGAIDSIAARAYEYVPWSPERVAPVPLVPASFDEATGGGGGGKYSLVTGC